MFKNMKVKAALIIGLTFCIGLLAGVLINRAIMQSQVKKFLRLPPPQIFLSHLARVIQPNKDQKEAINKLLKKYADKFVEMQETIKKNVTPIQEELKKELYPLLTKEQKERIEKHFSMMERFEKEHFFKDGRRPPGPGPWGDRPPKRDRPDDRERDPDTI